MEKFLSESSVLSKLKLFVKIQGFVLNLLLEKMKGKLQLGQWVSF